MRIAKNAEVTLTEAPTSRFLLVIDYMDGDVTVEKAGAVLIRIALFGDDVHATLRYPDGRSKTLVGENAKAKEVILTAGYARAGLYVGGVLLDEDFFYTPIDYKDAVFHAGSFSHFEAGYEYHSADESAIVEGVTDALDGFHPVGRCRTVTRVIPTAIGDRLHLLYLDGRTCFEAGKDKNAHKLSALFSDDGTLFHGAPIALGIDNVREEDILDAALLKKDGRYYLYYIVRYQTHKTLSCAVSEDGFSYMKTGLDVEISGVKNADITAIALLDGDTPRLYFTQDEKAFFTESIDLLHFRAPTALGVDNVDKVIPLPDGTLYAQKDETLYRIEEESLLPIANAPAYAYPVIYRGTPYAFGVKDGGFACEKR